MCLEAGYGRRGMIGHTQPRRIAARSIASRLADELGTQVGSWVGYKIRFQDQTAPQTLVKLMTDGVLLAETQHDRQLRQYDALIIDEAHERSLNIDFLLGYLRRLQARRPELRTIITSATIDAERFAAHFDEADQPAPVIEVSGRGYPVEIRYRPWEEMIAEPTAGAAATMENRLLEPDLARQVIMAFDELLEAGPGDVLVFLPTERDIRELASRMAGHLKRRGRAEQWEVLPLFARLSSAAQQAVFQPSGKRHRIILATNVAESSLTVPGIRYVIDSGLARVSRYSPRSKVQRLPIERIARASADQRAGRCGRLGPGICIRLFSADDYMQRERFTTPEIRRTPLASVLLQAMLLRLGPIREFPLLDPPRDDQIREGYRTLLELGAIDSQQQLTSIGRRLGHLPIDPRLGRILLEAEKHGCEDRLLVIAAALEIPDPRERPAERRAEADASHARFVDPASDFLSLLRLWDYCRLREQELSRTQFRKQSAREFLSHNRLREWFDMHRQLKGLLRYDAQRRRGASRGDRMPQTDEAETDERQIRPSKNATLTAEPLALPTDASTDRDRLYAAIHQCLLAGLLSGVAQRSESRSDYLGAYQQQLFLWPGSSVFATKPKWIVAAELVETSRRFARTVAAIDPRWIEPLAGTLVKRSYSDPHWSQKRQAAFCYERVTLFGLVIEPHRRIPLAPVDPQTARELLIERGLVEGQLQTRARFWTHNQCLMELLQQWCARARRRDLLVDPLLVQRFYEQRVPADVTDTMKLEQFDRSQGTPAWARQLQSLEDIARWLETHGNAAPAVDPTTTTLYMVPSDLLGSVTVLPKAEDFPRELAIEHARLPLEYHFEPGQAHDGVVLTVPKAALGQLADERLGWLVPGLLEEKLTALIKALPKRLRRLFVPAADAARLVTTRLNPVYGQVPFMLAVCQQLSAIAGEPIRPVDFTEGKLPEHLQFLVRVVDDDGRQIALGRDLAALKAELLPRSDNRSGPGSGVVTVDEEAGSDQTGLRSLPADGLPASVQRRRGGVLVTLYPALLDQGTRGVDLVLVDSPHHAAMVSRRGLARLYAMAEPKELRKQLAWLPELAQLQIKLARIGPPELFREQLLLLLARLAFVEGEPVPGTVDDFELRRLERGRRIADATQRLARWLPTFADAYHQARLAYEELKRTTAGHAIADIGAQLDLLLAQDFLLTTDWIQLEQYPRYLRGIAYRIDKLRGAKQRDEEATGLIKRHVQQWQGLRQAPNSVVDPARLDEYRWAIEELRISLLAQPLGTAIKVSPQRLDKMFQELSAGLPPQSGAR